MILSTLAHLVMETSATDNGLFPWILAAGPVGGAATYWALFRYYRNTDKSHHYERDTIIETQPIRGTDEWEKKIFRTRDAFTKGRNDEDHRARVQRGR